MNEIAPDHGIHINQLRQWPILITGFCPALPNSNALNTQFL